ncbi:hypothetical protein [Streptomyces sp. BA2]|uniref:hypothetical protein n=1 Tax=Streptomyces sp. BA2 TaxID=436595 RepID=UPI00132C34D5|nr:hypothetical protein [Streptomyces sp. BA2]MWA10694.1 hypothetical protein [Streptomyces sp. BA2]
MPSITLAIACLLIVTLGYASVCAVSPFGNCRRCSGVGFATKTDRQGRIKRGKRCRRCKGYGKRIRVGRHLYNLCARTHREGTR